MSFRSNFKTVRLSSDGASLHVTGASDTPVTAIHVSVVKRPVGDASVPPRTEQQGEVNAQSIPTDWDLDIAIETGTFEEDDAVLLAGAALREDSPPDVWVDSVKILPPVSE